MRPTDEGGGGDRGGGAGGSGAPAARVLDLENPLSFTSLLVTGAQQLLAGDGGRGGGGGGAAAARTRDSEDVSLNGLEFFVDLQTWGCADNVQESLVESNIDWHNMEEDTHIEEDDVAADCEDGEESESDNYDDFLVRCEGDTDVEDCFPTQLQEAVVEEVRYTAEMQQGGRVKDAKYKAEMTRAAKRRAVEGVVEDQGIPFSDQDSDDCMDLNDSREGALKHYVLEFV